MLRSFFTRSVSLGAIAALCLFTVGSPFCTAAEPENPFQHPPAWIGDQTMYEVNLRQFSTAGNVDGFAKQLPRLQKMGVGILWFMPVNPIGEEARSGQLGSPYAVRDYTKFNPEFGTIDQFKSAIDQAHRMGMFVVIDWVANHTAMDHPWVRQHPEWYKRDAQGQLVHPLPEWKDVAALNYDNAAMRTQMIDAMAYWVRDVGVDGFRCDSAEFTPLDFWVQARNALRKIKPVFMLAEGAKPELMNYAFDAAYGWSLSDNMQGIVKGTKTVPDLINYLNADAPLLPGDGFRLNFTTNHDKNAWEGTTREQLGSGVDAFTVLTFTVPGMPLIYNGQEAGAEHRLKFFDHDPIVWRDDPAAKLYHTLAELKRNNWALWDGTKPAPVQILTELTTTSVLTFQREMNGDRVVVMLNLSDRPAESNVPPDVNHMRLILSSDQNDETSGKLDLKPWAYRVWSFVP